MLEDTNEVLSDQAVVTKALVEQRYFGEIVDRYQEKLARYILRLGVRNPDDRDDVLQEIFVKVYRNLNAFDTSLSFSSWIYRIAHNEAISWYRKKNVRPEGHLIDDSDTIIGLISSREDGAEVEFDKEVNATVISQALTEVDEKYRTVIILRFFEHKEYEEISDILKIPIGTVGTLVYRGKKQLKKVLDQNKIRI